MNLEQITENDLRSLKVLRHFTANPSLHQDYQWAAPFEPAQPQKYIRFHPWEYGEGVQKITREQALALLGKEVVAVTTLLTSKIPSIRTGYTNHYDGLLVVGPDIVAVSGTVPDYTPGELPTGVAYFALDGELEEI